MYVYVEDSKTNLASLNNTTYEEKKIFLKQLCTFFWSCFKYHYIIIKKIIKTFDLNLVYMTHFWKNRQQVTLKIDRMENQII